MENTKGAAAKARLGGGRERAARRLLQYARWERPEQGRSVAGIGTHVKVDGTVFANGLGCEGKRFSPSFP